MFHQADLFDHIEQAPRAVAPQVVALPDLVERVSQISKRPRYVIAPDVRLALAGGY
jgi:hypothetical protein